jgi:hypothetical protein
MKTILVTIFVISELIASYTFRPVGAIAQTPSQVRFYCGQTFDPNSNKIVPTTLVASSAKKEPVALIQWKSKLSGKYTPQFRCNMVSAKFQQAWESKSLKYLTAGTDKKSGFGIICSSRDLDTPCNRSNMLFTLANGADANQTIDRIKDIKAGTGSNPVPESSRTGVVDVENIINQL